MTLMRIVPPYISDDGNTVFLGVCFAVFAVQWLHLKILQGYPTPRILGVGSFPCILVQHI